jgi:hypothetical protein
MALHNLSAPPRHVQCPFPYPCYSCPGLPKSWRHGLGPFQNTMVHLRPKTRPPRGTRFVRRNPKTFATQDRPAPPSHVPPRKRGAAGAEAARRESGLISFVHDTRIAQLSKAMDCGVFSARICLFIHQCAARCIHVVVYTCFRGYVLEDK